MTQVGDRVSGHFSKILCLRHLKEAISRLLWANGSLETEQVGLQSLATLFYRSLLFTEDDSATAFGSQQRVLSFVQRTVTYEMRHSLLTPFSETELFLVLRVSPKDSCSGEDGLLHAFFVHHWDILKEGLQLAFQEIMDTNSARKPLGGADLSHPQWRKP